MKWLALIVLMIWGLAVGCICWMVLHLQYFSELLGVSDRPVAWGLLAGLAAMFFAGVEYFLSIKAALFVGLLALIVVVDLFFGDHLAYAFVIAVTMAIYGLSRVARVLWDRSFPPRGKRPSHALLGGAS